MFGVPLSPKETPPHVQLAHGRLMAFADEVRQHTSSMGGTCGLGLLLASASAPDRNEYLEALADQTIQSKAIAKALQARGIDIAEQTVRRHRRGDCRCTR